LNCFYVLLKVRVNDQTDTAISNSGSNYERELVAWNDESVPAEGIDLDNMATDSQFDQFATNEKTFGFVSTYSDEVTFFAESLFFGH